MTSITPHTLARLSDTRTTTLHEWKDAQKELQNAKKNGASDTEIENLTNKQKAAFATFSHANSATKSILAGEATDETVNAILDKVDIEVESLSDFDPSTLTEMSPKDQLKMQRENPEEFRKQMDKVPAGDKQALYLGLQNEIQTENRFWSMMTNTQQAAHDTQKSIIANFRV